ncbi:RAP2C protein, partial [Odontophorus gujanensis]|nr:RAP2C protein [Odontophorus gujanensis]
SGERGPMREYKVVVLGSGGVGKSALTVQFVTGTFIEKYDPTVFLKLLLKREFLLFDQDLLGQLLLSTPPPPLIVSSMSLDIKPMRDQIVRVKRYEKVPLILVGNKVDLESEREVLSAEGRALAQEWGCPFMETSAKSKTMVDELFAEIVRQMNYASLPEKQDQCCTTCIVQ